MKEALNSPKSVAKSRLGGFKRLSTGCETVSLFLPAKLPPQPPIDFSAMQSLLVEASEALGRLDGLTGMLPDVPLLLYSYVRREAVYSSPVVSSSS